MVINMQMLDDIDKILADEALDIRVTDTLMELGVHADLCGYPYLRAAVMLATSFPELAAYPSKTIYPQIAKHYGTSPPSVERNCRRAVDNAYLSKNNGRIFEFFAERGISRKPTCKEFISAVADFIREE